MRRLIRAHSSPCVAQISAACAQICRRKSSSFPFESKNFSSRHPEFASVVLSTRPYPFLSFRKLFYPLLRWPCQRRRILLRWISQSEILGSGGTSNCQRMEASPMSNTDKIIRLETVLARTGLSRSTMYRKIDEGTFPAQVKISIHGVGWRESAINRWIDDPVAYRNDGAAQ